MAKMIRMAELLTSQPSIEFICQPGDDEFAAQLRAIYKTLYLIHLLFDATPSPPYRTEKGHYHHALLTRH